LISYHNQRNQGGKYIIIKEIKGEIHELNPSTDHHRIINTHEMIGSFAICSDGNFIAALQHGFSFINRENGEKKFISDPESDIPGNRFNDGKCDPAGRFWAGSMSFNTTDASASLYQLNVKLEVSKHATGITISNGLDWSLDKKTFYYIDTPTFNVDAFDYDNESGEITNRRTIIEIPKADGFPDGMCIDAAGMLWIAHWGGWQVTRWNPATGKKIDGRRNIVKYAYCYLYIKDSQLTLAGIKRIKKYCILTKNSSHRFKRSFMYKCCCKSK
jgi:sugar lactone lactonase YvrE